MSGMRARVLSETRRLRVRLVAPLKRTSIRSLTPHRSPPRIRSPILRRRWSRSGIRRIRRLGVAIGVEMCVRVGVHVRIDIGGGEVDDV